MPWSSLEGARRTGEAEAEARRDRSPTIAREERIERARRNSQGEGRWWGEGRAGDKSAELPMERAAWRRGGPGKMTGDFARRGVGRGNRGDFLGVGRPRSEERRVGKECQP